ncbi:MAG TPA: serine/threonine-protein kinase [Polyangiaceae bacterium]|nr:serine/threonine-protein kinase [Polyangiaceae bacterium]
MATAPQQRYKVLEKVAAGGMAEVYRAESAGLEGFKKIVAIKRVLPHLSEKKQFIGMFLDEARVSAHLSHSNCVQVFDIGVGDNTYFIVMEYVDGADLKGVIEFRRKQNLPFPVEEACLICVRICEGLAYAHELTDSRGESLHIVHRDMSPPNVLITRHGEVKIVDFGLAKANSQLERSEPGIIKGKFSYLSPEAAKGGTVDARTDIFAVGIILWELLAGRRLFLGDSDLETVRMVQSARIPSLRAINPAVPPELETVLAKALTEDPAHRYQRARDFGAALNQLLFHLGRSVSSFEIAELVEPIRREREQKRRAQKRQSIIGTLIDEAMLEFTSIDGDRKSNTAGSVVGSLPLEMGGFNAPNDWGEDLGNLGLSVPRAREQSTDAFEIGNLAALEDDPLSGRIRAISSSPPSPDDDSEPPPAIIVPPQQPLQVAPPLAPMPAPSNVPGKGFIVAVVALVVLAAGVGAYFGGLFPH